MFLVRFVLQAQRIAIAAILQVVYLPVTTIVILWVCTRPRVNGADLETCFAQNLHGCAAAGASSHHNRVVHFGVQKVLASNCRAGSRCPGSPVHEGSRVPDRRDGHTPASLATQRAARGSRYFSSQFPSCSNPPRCSPSSSEKMRVRFPLWA